MFFANVKDNRNPIIAVKFLSQKLDSTRIREIHIAGNVSAYVSFLTVSIFIREEQRQDRGRADANPCPEWSREVSAAWSRVGFSTSHPYILIIIIVGRSFLMRMLERT